ncbi:uncharacterized protein LOC129604859 [Betta splendens]|uniref:Uncharacterized protein LOC129604859 n=1 Tax=Betta splendens TaxID=158456 RepID=A0A9W2Y4U6_BETSP|nr:uncharacterized protein LOC129604859 [Betta splendens]
MRTLLDISVISTVFYNAVDCFQCTIGFFDDITHCVKTFFVNLSLKFIRRRRTLRAFIANSMRLWRTTLEANGKPLAQVSIKCGIYQRDALSPLLFCIGLNTLSQIINKTGYGYRLRNEATISHLLYMDDIKLYAKSERDIDSLIHTTSIYSSDIGMSFGLEKCGRMVTKRGKVIHTEGVSLPEGTIADIEDNYKYLGIPQANGNLEQATRNAATSKYLLRVRQVLRSQLNGKNKSRAINTEALILAAQEQALSTRPIEARIYHTRQDPRCRLCKEAPESIQHITAGCKMLAGKAYMKRHNQVAGIVYRNICAEYGLETPRSKWETPE